MTFTREISDDGFGALLGAGRGVPRSQPSDAVSVSYRAFTVSELDELSCLVSGDERIRGILEVAKAEPDVLDELPDGDLMRLQALRDPGFGGRDQDSLLSKLGGCQRARDARDLQRMREAGARPFEMYSVEGNLAVTRLVDSLVGIPNVQVQDKLDAGRAAIGRVHQEVSDTAVSEAIWEDLIRLGVIDA